MEIYSGIQPVAGDNVAHFAHLGGMLIGYLILKYWSRNSRNFY
jgi:membrane associated rhomboid family serine protease